MSKSERPKSIGHSHQETSKRSKVHHHSHGFVDDEILRSKQGIRTVFLALGVLGISTAIQMVIYKLTNSVALFADLVHDLGDLFTAVPLIVAFVMHSKKAERVAGYIVVSVIFLTACVAAYEAVERILHPEKPVHLFSLFLAGVIGLVASLIVSKIRISGGKRLSSTALIADGHHALQDALLSIGVIISAIALYFDIEIVDPIIGLVITFFLFKIAWQSFFILKNDTH